MIKAKPVQGAKDFALTLSTGEKLIYSEVLTSAWESPDGKRAQLLVNFLPEEKNIFVDCATVYSDENPQGVKTDGNVTIAPLSAVWVTD